MNRVDFMNQLESLLQSISSTEREEAIQYYNDYFDDAGAENEQEVIEALGNPARVAENIKRDLAGNGYVEAARKVKASDRVLMEYGKEIPEEEGTGGTGEAGKENRAGFGSGAEAGKGTFDSQRFSGYGSSLRNAAGQGGQTAGSASEGYGRQSGSTSAGYGRQSGSASTGYGQQEQAASTDSGQNAWTASGQYEQRSENADSGYRQQNGSAYSQYEHSSRDTFGSGNSGTWDQNHANSSAYTPEKRKKGEGMPAWAIAMLVTVLVLASPAILGILLSVGGVLIGGAACWFGMIFGFGVAAIVLLVLLVVLVAVGIICMFVSPWAGMALVGGGLICGGIGLLLLMLTVAMAGIATPAIFRGIGFVFRGFRKKPAKAY